MSVDAVRPPLVVNARFLSVRPTGVQRVAAELTRRLDTAHQLMRPRRRGAGVTGYYWEQVSLPRKLDGRLLWSPCNVGPVSVRRQIVTIHDAALIDHPEWFSPSFVLGCRTVWSQLVHVARQLVTVSEFSRRRLALAFGLPESAFEVVHNGVDESFRPRSPEEVARVFERLRLAPAPYFATLCTVEPRKNLRLVLGAWSRARGRLPAGARLLVIGGRGASHLFGRGEGADLRDEGVVELGYADDDVLPAVLSGAMGVLYPSLYEGFGLPLVEAMACGAPVVTTRLASLPEVAGDAALYVDPFDPDDLASTLVRLASSSSLRSELSARSVERAAGFSWGKAAALHDQIISRHI